MNKGSMQPLLHVNINTPNMHICYNDRPISHMS